MPIDQDTKPMRRLPNSPPRISRRLLFPILMFVGIDLGFLGLLLVILATPVKANYPKDTTPVLVPRAVPASVAAVILPTPAPRTTTSAPVRPAQTTPVYRVAPTTHRPSATRTAAPAPTPTHSAVINTPAPTLTMTPPRPSTPVPTPSESGT